MTSFNYGRSYVGSLFMACDIIYLGKNLSYFGGHRGLLLYGAVGGIRFFRNVTSFLKNYVASHQIRL